MHNLILLWIMSFVLGIMRISSPLSLKPATALALTAAVAIVILFTANNVTITNAQQPQQPQPPTSQPAVTQNRTSSSLFQSTEDGFRVQVPDGWVIHDMKNTGYSLLTEVLQGYGVLAQLCPEEQQQTVRNVGGSSSSSGGNTLSSSSS